MLFFKLIPTFLLIFLNSSINILSKFDNLYILDQYYKINIIYNFENLYEIFQDIYIILFSISLFYVVLFISFCKFKKFYEKFKNKNPNLIESKTNYFLWGELLLTFYHFHDFSTFILLFISSVQIKFLNKKINFINYILLILYGLINSIIDWCKDYEIHKQNNKKCMIIRNKQLIYVNCSNIKVGDILYLRRNNSVKVKEAIVLDQDIVAFNLGQTGERTIEEFKVGSKILEGLIIKNQELVKLLVSKTYSSNKITEFNINTIGNLNNIMTYLGIITIIVFSLVIIIIRLCVFQIPIQSAEMNTKVKLPGTFLMCNGIKNKNVLEIGELLLDVLGCFIGLNYLLPSFKISQSLNLWDSVYRSVTIRFSDFKVCNHGDLSINYNPDNTVILSDKTGTLTNNILSIQQIYIDENELDLIIGHMNSFLDDDLKHTSHSPETNVISNYIHKKYKIQVKNSYHWIDKEQIIEYNNRGNLFKIIRINKQTYKDSNQGSHSLLCKNDKYYHVFLGSKYLLSNKLGYIPNIQSVKRGLIMGIIETNINNLEENIKKFRENKIDQYKIIGEFHFNNFYRENKFQSTKNGIRKLKALNYPFIVITGDSILTAKDIGIELGIIDNNDDVIDGSEFINKLENEKDDIIKNLLEKRGGVFGNTRAIYKEKIVEYFKQYKKVVFLGDQENDYLALCKSDLAIVQEKGNNKCKNIANLIGNIPTEIAYSYLTKYRNIGIEGKYWFFLKLNVFNYFTSGIWLIALIDKNLTKTNIIFNDPWEPRDSLIMSIIISIYLIYQSFSIKKRNNNKTLKCIITSIITLMISIMIGYCLYLMNVIGYLSIITIVIYMIYNGFIE